MLTYRCQLYVCMLRQPYALSAVIVCVAYYWCETCSYRYDERSEATIIMPHVIVSKRMFIPSKPRFARCTGSIRSWSSNNAGRDRVRQYKGCR